MTPGLILLVLDCISLLMVVAYLTSRKADQSSSILVTVTHDGIWLLLNDRCQPPSGTFMSVPGAVGDGGFHYFQIVLGYLAGYLVIIRLLLPPLYYRMQLDFHLRISGTTFRIGYPSLRRRTLSDQPGTRCILPFISGRHRF